MNHVRFGLWISLGYQAGILGSSSAEMKTAHFYCKIISFAIYYMYERKPYTFTHLCVQY